MKYTPILKGFCLFTLTVWTLFACKPDENGISIPNQRGTTARLIDTVAIELSSLLLDSIENSGLNYVLLGRMQDGTVSGITQATAFVEILPATTPVGFPANAILDSTTVTLEYDLVYGQRQPFSFQVHRLTDSLRRNLPYTNLSTVGYEPDVWQTVHFTPKLLQAPITYDTVRFRLDTLGKLIFAQQGQSSMATVSGFRSFVKGLAFVPLTSVQNTLLRFDTDIRTFSRVRIFYHTPTNPAPQFVTLVLDAVNFSQVVGNRNGTFFSALQKRGDRVVPTSAHNYSALLQGGTGVRLKVDFPLAQLRALKNKIILQRAELLLYPQETSTYPPAHFLVAAEATAQNQLPTTADRDVIFSLFDGDNPSQFLFRYDESRQVYAMNITAYIHQLIYQERNSHGLIISVANTAVSPERVLINGFQATDKPARLRLFYTIP